MTWLKRVLSSLVVRITALTLAALTLMFALVFFLMQTPLLTHVLYPAALTDNADSIAELVWLIETSPDELQPFILSAYGGIHRTAALSKDFEADLQPRTKMRTRLIMSENDVASRLDNRDIRFQRLGALASNPNSGRKAPARCRRSPPCGSRSNLMTNGF